MDKDSGCSNVYMSERLSLKLSLAECMRYQKGKRALILFAEKAKLRMITVKNGRTLFARGYYVSTVGLNEDVIRN